MLRRVDPLFLLIFILSTAGCGNEAAVELAPVSGTITLNGLPLANANVTFVPDSKGALAPTSSGTTDAEGKYKLEAPLGSGAMPGKHQVRISKYAAESSDDGDAGGAPTNEIPPKYNVDTELSIDVPATGRDDADFKLVK